MTFKSLNNFLFIQMDMEGLLYILTWRAIITKCQVSRLSSPSIKGVLFGPYSFSQMCHTNGSQMEVTELTTLVLLQCGFM